VGAGGKNSPPSPPLPPPLSLSLFLFLFLFPFLPFLDDTARWQILMPLQAKIAYRTCHQHQPCKHGHWYARAFLPKDKSALTGEEYGELCQLIIEQGLASQHILAELLLEREKSRSALVEA
jgi:hypothetical protein